MLWMTYIANSFNYTLSLTQNIPFSTVSALKTSGQLSYTTVDPYRPRVSRGKGKNVEAESSLDGLLVELRKAVEDGGYR